MRTWRKALSFMVMLAMLVTMLPPVSIASATETDTTVTTVDTTPQTVEEKEKQTNDGNSSEMGNEPVNENSNETDDGSSGETDNGSGSETDNGSSGETDNGSGSKTDNGSSGETDNGSSGETDNGSSSKTDNGSSGETDNGSSGETDNGSSGETDNGSGSKTDNGSSGETDNGSSGETDNGSSGETDNGSGGETDNGSGSETDGEGDSGEPVTPPTLAIVNEPGTVTYGSPDWVPVVAANGFTLTKDKDYTVSYNPTDDRNAGTEVTVTVTGKDGTEYAGLDDFTTYKIVRAPLTVTTLSDTKIYDGEPLTAAGATITGLVGEDNGKVTITATGKQTEPGSSENTYEINWGGVEASNYTITKKLGTLTVVELKVKVTVKGGEYEYDGKLHQAEVKVEALMGGVPCPMPDVYSYSVKDDVPAATNVDDTTGAKLESFSVTILKDGVQVNPQPEITYDLDNSAVTITSYEDEVTVNIKGEELETVFTGKEQSVKKEYEVTSIDGLDGFSEEIQEKVKNELQEAITSKESEAKVSGTNVGEYTMGLTSDSFVCLNKNFSKVTFEVEDGKLTITDRPEELRYPIQLVANSSEEAITYDGQSHSVKGLASATLMYMDDEVVGQIVYNDDGISTVTFDVGDGTVFTLTTGAIYAKATDVCYKYPVGSEDIEIQVSLNNVDVTDNFDLAFTPGTLTINPRLVIITANDNPNEVYDGKAYEPNASMEEEEQEPELPYTVSADPDIADSGLVADHTVNATIEVWTEPETEDGQSVKLEDGAINAGTYKLKINAGNVKITSADNVDVTANYVIQLDDGTLTINRRPVTISVITPRAKVYDGKAYDPNASIEEGQEEQESKLPFTVSADPDIADSGLVADHTVNATIEVWTEPETEDGQSVKLEDGAINAGTYTLRINNDEEGTNKVKITDGTNDVTDNYAITLGVGTLTIDPRPVYVYATGSKSFGTVDPVDDEGNLVFEIKDDVAQNEAKNVGMVDGEVLNVDGAIIVNGVEKGSIDVGTLARAKGEQPGEYEIKSDNDGIKSEEGQVQGNYTVHFLTMNKGDDGASTGSFFTITKDMPWTVKWLVDETDKAPINSHDAQAAFCIVPEKDVELLPAEAFGEAVTATVTATAPDGESAVTWESLPDFTKEMTWADDETNGLTATFGIPDVNYSFVTGEGEDATTYAWTSGLPEGTEVTIEVAYKKQTPGEETAAPKTVETFVVPVKTEIGFSYPENAHNGDTFMVMDANGFVKLAQNAPYVCDKEVISVTINGSVTIYMTYGNLRDTGLNLEALKALLGITAEAAWCNPNPAEDLTITAALVDSLNHVAAAANGNVRFDTGAVNTTQTVGNRPTEESIALNIGESEQFGALSENPVTGAFGGSTPVITAADGVPTWTNVAAWKDTPADLPHSGESFTVAYTDWVGNPGTHTFNVVRSQAVTDLSIAVQPMTDGTVPNARLTFSGSANVWEELILTVGGRTYTPDMLPGNAVYDNSAKRWSYSINIADIDGFPVGEETTVTIAYADLSGGTASIKITYKDHVDEPVLGGEPLAGSQVIWGFVEQQTTDVQIDVYRAATDSWVAVDVVHGNGYFSSELLDEPLAEGDRVRIAVQDFCGNYASAEFPVVTELSQHAFAELLGASITGEVGGEMLHRFATPIDLAELNVREDKSITVPILAYKGIDIGTVTATLTPQGRVEVTYDIGLTSVLAGNAQARVHVFADEPTIANIVNATMTVAAEDLNAASSGTLTSVDVTAYQTENGYAGTLWLCAQFDIDMDEEVYCNTVNYSIDGFYRMLPDEMMTEELTGVVRDDSVITYYVDNASYYQLYREFTNRSNMN